MEKNTALLGFRKERMRKSAVKNEVESLS
jgi:hypothetical protein